MSVQARRLCPLIVTMRCNRLNTTLLVAISTTLLSSVACGDIGSESRTDGASSAGSSRVDRSDGSYYPVYQQGSSNADFHDEQVGMESSQNVYSGGYQQRQGLDRDGAEHQEDHGHHEDQTEGSSSYYTDDYNYADVDGDYGNGGYGYATDHDHGSYNHHYHKETTTSEEPTTTTTEAPTTTTPAPEPKEDPYKRVGSYVDGLAIFLIPWMVILCLGLLLPWIESLARRRSLSDNYTFQLDQFNDILTNSMENFECLRWFKCQSENAIVRRSWGKPALRLLEKFSPASVASWASSLSETEESSCEQYKCSNFGTKF